MRAIVARRIGAPEDLVIEDVPPPSPGPGEVAVDIKAAAVNFPDLLVVEGKYQTIPDLPFSPGKEGAGVVSAIGDGVAAFGPGDRVMVLLEYGVFAEQLTAPADHCFAIPDDMGFDAAAAIGIAYQTAYFALVERAHVEAGESVLVTGASGSVGLAALQLAKAFGCTVLAGLTTMEKAEVARESGADHVIDLTAGDPRDSIRDQIRDATGGGVDLVVEIIGGAVFEGSIRSVNWGGRLVIVGFTGGTIATMKTNYPLLKNIAVIGLNWSDYRDRDPARVARVQDEIFRLYRDGRIRVPVQATYPMDEFVKAFDVIRQRQVRGKVVLRF